MRDRQQATIVSHEIHGHGGQERVTAQLVQSLLDKGWSVTTIARRCDLPEHPRLRKITVPGPRPAALAFPWFFVVGGLLVRRHRTGLLHINGSVVPNTADLSTVHFCHAAFEEIRAVEGFGARRGKAVRTSPTRSSQRFLPGVRTAGRSTEPSPSTRRGVGWACAGARSSLSAHGEGGRDDPESCSRPEGVPSRSRPAAPRPCPS